MRKYIILLIFCCFLFGGCASEGKSYLRVHIRANSNSESDQNIKYLIKDVVVEYLTPKLSGCESKNGVILALNDNMHSTKELIDGVLNNLKLYLDTPMPLEI